MKKTFLSNHSDIKEVIELVDEEDWIYVRYIRNDDLEKKSYILKNEKASIEELLWPFLIECNASEFMKNKIRKYEQRQNESKKLLLMGATYHLTVVASSGILIFLGYKLGALADLSHSIFPIYTILGVFVGLGTGILFSYKMFQRYLKPLLT